MTEPVIRPGPIDAGGEGPSWPAPAWLVEDARRFAASGQPPAPPRRAATVVLLRPCVPPPRRGVRRRSAVDGFEVYAQRRATTMAFAPNLYAFPGGTVDPRDASADVAWCGPDLTDWSARLGLPPDEARAVICAAVREVFEECGVLLAGPDETTVLGNVEGAEWEQIRLALLARDVSLAGMLAARGLAVRADLLTAWARWLTPEFEPRRYDTFFFLARLPGEQRTRDVGGEAIDTVWLRPSEAGRLPMLPPTAYTLHQLCAYPSIEQALAAGPTHDLTTPTMPYIHIDPDDGARLALPA